jgi:dolichol-phosphate mannosyltransferase
VTDGIDDRRLQTTSIAARTPADGAMISVILPIYRTAIYLNELYRRLTVSLQSQALRFELIMIDDGSPDNAWAVIASLAEKDGRVKGLRLSRNFGQHPALAAGFAHASGDVVVWMDADLQDRPEDIPTLLSHLKDDVDIVYTIKEGQHVAWGTQLTSRLYNSVFSKITGAAVPRDIGTFRVFTRRVLETLLACPERHVLYGPLMFHLGFTHAVVALQRDARKGSGSSYTFGKRLALAVNSLLSYTDLPHRVMINGGLMFLLADAIAAVAVFAHAVLWRHHLPEGIALIALLLVFMMGVVMLSLGIIGLYVFRIYQEVLRRPRYAVARRINFEASSSTGIVAEKGTTDRHG